MRGPEVALAERFELLKKQWLLECSATKIVKLAAPDPAKALEAARALVERFDIELYSDFSAK